MRLNKDETFAEFDALRETSVQENLNLRIYSGDRKLLAEEWLRQQADRRSAAFQAEQIAIASAAKDAAVEAAEAARVAADAALEQARTATEANTIAKIALLIAIVAAVAAMLTLFE